MENISINNFANIPARRENNRPRFDVTSEYISIVYGCSSEIIPLSETSNDAKLSLGSFSSLFRKSVRNSSSIGQTITLLPATIANVITHLKVWTLLLQYFRNTSNIFVTLVAVRISRKDCSNSLVRTILNFRGRDEHTRNVSSVITILTNGN